MSSKYQLMDWSDMAGELRHGARAKYEKGTVDGIAEVATHGTRQGN
jgi:hypothetical protein